jgi:hypothetical protein
MARKSSPQDLNDIAIANLRELIAADDKLLSAWKTNLATVLKDNFPHDLNVLRQLVALEQRNDSAQTT